jgi:hypothetical protein
MKDGNYKEAPKTLVELQEHVQVLTGDVATDAPFLLEDFTEGSLKLPRGIVDLLHVLTYLVSGVLHKMDDPTKAKMFLEEGLKVGAEMEPADWSSQIRFLFLRHLCEVHAMRSSWDESLECIDAQLELLDGLPLSLREACEPMVYLDLGMIYQGQGNMVEAKVWLEGALKGREVSVQLMAKMHLFVMSLEDPDEVPYITCGKE